MKNFFQTSKGNLSQGSSVVTAWLHQVSSQSTNVVTQGQYYQCGYTRPVLPVWLHKVSTTSVVSQGQYYQCGYTRSVLPVWLHKVSTTSVVTQGQYYQCGYTRYLWICLLFIEVFFVICVDLQL